MTTPDQDGRQDIGPAECGDNMIIYKITNTLNNLAYIGYTRFSLNERWTQHYKTALKETKNRKFYNAIRKYNKDVWAVEIIDEANNATEAKLKEIFYIEKHNTYYNGYNATKGGDGNNNIIMSTESNQARSQKLKGIKKSEETIKKFKNRKQTEVTCQKISKSHLGKKKPWVKWTKDQCRKRGLTRRSITEQQYNLIHEYRKQNYKITDISKIVGISNDLVKKWLHIKW